MTAGQLDTYAVVASGLGWINDRDTVSHYASAATLGGSGGGGIASILLLFGVGSGAMLAPGAAVGAVLGVILAWLAAR